MRESRPVAKEPSAGKSAARNKLFWANPSLKPEDFEPGELARHREGTVDENGVRTIRYTKMGDAMLDNHMAMLYESKGYELTESSREFTFKISDAEYQADKKVREDIAARRQDDPDLAAKMDVKNERRFTRERLENIRATASSVAVIPGEGDA